MIKISFVCHGNICRSPMAEMIFKDMLREKGLEEKFEVCSMATSREEIGNDVHQGTKRVLAEHGIPCEKRRAVQITKEDYQAYDYIICMDDYNVRNLEWRIGEDIWGKVSLLMDYTSHPRDIADPWYTGNFELTYKDINEGCKGLLEKLINDMQ